MAKWTVRTKEGELTYGSFGEVEQAWLSGMVGPDDELKEEGHDKWRKATTFPLLVQARKHGNQVWGGTQMVWLIVLIALGSLAMYFLVEGARTNNYQFYLFGG